jgi:glycosyltransferase involved in cell wall biosynthesis
MVHLSVVIPVYNESSLIDELVKRVKINIKLITEDYEIIIVDDGSQDATWNFIENAAKSENKIKGIKFSRNFGHHYAITAGLHNANGDWVVVMDGDLQDRPEVIPELYHRVKSGFDVVFVSRRNRPETLYYRMAQKIFYWLLRLLSGINFDSRQANFSIISKKVVEAFKIFPENARFYGSTIKWLGFKTADLEADHGVRFSGRPSYTLRKRIKLAVDIILSFSERPLKFAIGFGIFSSTISFIFFLDMTLGRSSSLNDEVTTTFILSSLYFLSGSILIVLGIIGVFLGRVFQETKKRPLYIISESFNLK